MAQYDRVVLHSMEEEGFAYALNRDEQGELAMLMKSLKRCKSRIRDVPDMYFLGYRKDTVEADNYAIFLEKGLVFGGLHLDAWSEAMYERKSRCLILDESAKDFLGKILKHVDEHEQQR